MTNISFDRFPVRPGRTPYRKFSVLISTFGFTFRIWETIVSYVCENGDITSQDLINVEPFSEVDWVGVFGAQTQGVGKFVGYIHDIVVA